MLTKFMLLLLFCGALINAKSLVQRDPRLREIKEEEIDHVKFPNVFNDLMQGLDNAELEQNGYGKVGVYPRVQLDDDKFEAESEKESGKSDDVLDAQEIDESQDGKKVQESNKDLTLDEKNKEDEVGEENEEGEHDEEEKAERYKITPEDSNKIKLNNEEDDEDDDDDKDEDDKDEDEDDKDEDEDDKDEDEDDKDEDEDDNQTQNKEDEEDDSHSESDEDPVVSSNTKIFTNHVGSQNLYQDSFKFAKDYLDSSIPASNFINFKSLTKNINLESLMKNFPPSKKSSLKHQSNNKEADLFKFDQDSLMEQIKNSENEDKMEDIEANGAQFNLDNPSVGSFIPQSFSKSFNDLQKNFPGFTNFWKKNPRNVNSQKPVQKEAKVGFGGWNNEQRLVFGDLTNYVNKAVNQNQARLEENGRVIIADNPELTINVIPGVPIVFKLQRVEGANTLDTYGHSKGIHYDKLYAFTQYKFAELRYYYDVKIKPLNLFSIRKSITITLNEAPTRMNAVVEKDNTMKIMGMEIVDPKVSLDVGTHRYVNSAINYLVNEYLHPVVKQILVEIVTTDSKLLVTKYLQDAQ